MIFVTYSVGFLLDMSTRKRSRTEQSTDPEQWLQWFNELNEESEEEKMRDQETVDESDEGEEDVIIESDHESDTEQELSECDSDLSDDNDDMDSQSYYIGKDGDTKWRKAQPPKNVRTRAHNIITHLPGPIRAAREAKSEIQALDLFISEDILSIITISTNIYVELVRQKFARDRDARLTNMTEIRGFIGLLYLIGSLRSSRKNLHQLWDNSKGNGLESCYLTMSEQRFRFLLRCIRFDDVRDRPMRSELDKFSPIRELFERMVLSFQNYYSASEFLTIDEQLLAFRGRCSFRQYIPSKPSKYGIKTFALVDAKTAYTLKLETYVGTQPPGPYNQSNAAKDIVIRMVEPVQNTNRNITADNWFTSFPLVSELSERKLTYVGTLRKNKKEIPKEFLPNKNRPENSSLFGFRENSTLVSYCPKKQKVVLVVSSMHHDAEIDRETGEKQKPAIITFYNHTKIGVDLVDQLCQKNNVARNTRRWPMVVFYNLLNVAAINAFCIYKANQVNARNKLIRTDFLKNIAWEMVKPQIRERSRIPQIPRELSRRALLLLEENPPVLEREDRRGARGRCFYCGRARDKTTRKWCASCNRWVCNEHLKEICVSCYEQANV